MPPGASPVRCLVLWWPKRGGDGGNAVLSGPRRGGGGSPRMHSKGRDLRGGPRGGWTGGWRRLPKRKRDPTSDGHKGRTKGRGSDNCGGSSRPCCGGPGVNRLSCAISRHPSLNALWQGPALMGYQTTGGQGGGAVRIFGGPTGCQNFGGAGGGGAGPGGVGTRPRYLIVCLWRRLLASRHCTS